MVELSNFEKHSKYLVRNKWGNLELCELVEINIDESESNVTHFNYIGEYVYWSQCIWTDSQTFGVVKRSGFVVDKLLKEWKWGSLGSTEAIVSKSLNWDASFKSYLQQFEVDMLAV